MLNQQKTSIFLIKEIKWEISPKQNKRSLKKKESQKKSLKQQPQQQQQEKMAEKKLALKYKYEDLFQLDIPNLMLNIWCYSDEHGLGCSLCTTYKKYCINALKKKWDTKKSKNVADIIQKLKKRDQKWFNLSRVSSADRYILLELIKK